MLAERRARLHAAVAEALIELDADRLDEEAALVAWHWERAGRGLEAAQWSLRAGAFAMRSDLGEALRRWRAAVNLLAGLDETPESLDLGVRARMRLLQYGARLGIALEEADRLGAEGTLLAQRLGDVGMTALMVGFPGSVKFWAGDLEGGLVRYLEAAKLVERVDDLDVKALLGFAVSLGFTYTGRLADAMSWVDRTLALCADNVDRAVEHLGYSVLPRILQVRAVLRANMGRLSEAREDAEQSLTLVRSRSEPESLCWALAVVPLVAWLVGGCEDVSARAVEAVRVAEETGNPGSLVLGLEALALTHLMAGQPVQGVGACARALAVGRDKGSGLFAEASVLAHLALARLAAGDLAAAAVAADEAVEVARRQGARVNECLALLARARVARLASATTHAVRADLDAALALVQEVGALTYEPFIREELGSLRGDERALREAVRLYEVIGATGHARRLAAELAGQASVQPNSSARKAVERQA